jgi:hypothetical protein
MATGISTPKNFQRTSIEGTAAVSQFRFGGAGSMVKYKFACPTRVDRDVTMQLDVN